MSLPTSTYWINLASERDFFIHLHVDFQNSHICLSVFGTKRFFGFFQMYEKHQSFVLDRTP